MLANPMMSSMGMMGNPMQMPMGMMGRSGHIADLSAHRSRIVICPGPFLFVTFSM
jgi:hypothetical protein